MNDLGARLTQLRIQHDLSQGQVAYHAGLSPSHISMFESGQRVPTLRNLVKLADVFGLRVSELLTGVNLGEKVNVIPFDELQEMHNGD